MYHISLHLGEGVQFYDSLILIFPIVTWDFSRGKDCVSLISNAMYGCAKFTSFSFLCQTHDIQPEVVESSQRLNRKFFNLYMWLGLQKSAIWAQKVPIFCIYFIITNNYIYYHNKIYITTVEFNMLSSSAYRNEILHSEQKILV